MRVFIILLAFSVGAFGQFAQRIRFVTTNPSGACGPSFVTQNTTTGVLTGCVGGTWTALGGGGSTAASSITAGTFGAGNYVFPGNLTIGATVVSTSAGTTSTILIDKGGMVYNLKSFAGVTGDGSDQTTALQAALAAIPAGAHIFLPDGSYKTKSLDLKAGQTFELSSGAILIALPQSPGNQLFGLGSAAAATVTLTTALQGATSIAVTSTSGFTAGDRIIVSAGTFTGSGTEQGPIEFNTVSAVTDGTNLALASPLKYSYSAFGLPSASPVVHRLSATYPHNIRITGGTIQPDSTFDSIYFNFSKIERVEIDHVFINGVGNGLSTGAFISQLNFHDNRVVGTATQSSGSGLAMASMVESRVTNNDFNITSASGLFNTMICEVGCRDNIISGNRIGPIPVAGTAIEFDFNSFNNSFLNNIIWGNPADITGGISTLGIRTYASSTLASFGNIITGNLIMDIMHGIGDGSPDSIIRDNILSNSTTHANTSGIITGDSNLSIFGPNRFKNVTTEHMSGGSANAGFSIMSGTAAAPTNAAVGAVYFKLNGAIGESAWYRENVGGTPTWLARNAFGGPIAVNTTTNVAGNLFRPAATSTQTTDLYVGRAANTAQAADFGFNYNSTAANSYAYVSIYGDTTQGFQVFNGNKAGLGTAGARPPTIATDVPVFQVKAGVIYSGAFTFDSNQAVCTYGAIASPVSFSTGFGWGNACAEYLRMGPTAGQMTLTSATGVLNWGSSAFATPDIGLSRGAAGEVWAGSGAQGSSAGTFRGSYKSSDGTTGVTVTDCTGFKNGLCISGT